MRGWLGAIVAVLMVSGCTAVRPAKQSPIPDPTRAATATVSNASPSLAPPPSPSRTPAVAVVDLSFVGVDDGWALASAGCLGGPGVCTAIYNTTNGTTWHRLPDAPFNVGGAGGDIGCEASSPCVDGIRFANATDGYVFGNAALYMTTDGGDTWARQSGFGADSLEIGGGMVTRISIDNVPHPVVEQAPVGSTTWTPIRLPGGTPITQIGGGVSVGGSGQLAVIAVTDYAESKGVMAGSKRSSTTPQTTGRTGSNAQTPARQLAPN